MTLVPRSHELFYLSIVVAIIAATMVIVLGQKIKNPQYNTSKASYSTPTESTPQMDMNSY